MDITFGYINYNKEVYEKYYQPSISNLLNHKSSNHNLSIISTDSINKPAKNYNTLINKAKTKYLFLTHTDITFGIDLLDRIDETIKLNTDFGALGIVGVDSKNNYKWGMREESFVVETLDCCSILINLDHLIYFDDAVFSDYHLYVEDYCIQAKEKNLNCHTILINSTEMSPNIKYFDIHEESFFCHHSHTLNKLGCGWGKYWEYKNKLNKKWNRQVPTT